MKKDEPDLNVIQASLKDFKRAENYFNSIFLKNNDFVGGQDLNICDLIATSTFEQARFINFEFDQRTQDYINCCQEKIEGYDHILKELKELPSLIDKLSQSK